MEFVLYRLLWGGFLVIRLDNFCKGLSCNLLQTSRVPPQGLKSNNFWWPSDFSPSGHKSCRCKNSICPIYIGRRIKSPNSHQASVALWCSPIIGECQQNQCCVPLRLGARPPDVGGGDFSSPDFQVPRSNGTQGNCVQLRDWKKAVFHYTYTCGIVSVSLSSYCVRIYLQAPPYLRSLAEKLTWP